MNILPLMLMWLLLLLLILMLIIHLTILDIHIIFWRGSFLLGLHHELRSWNLTRVHNVGVLLLVLLFLIGDLSVLLILVTHLSHYNVLDIVIYAQIDSRLLHIDFFLTIQILIWVLTLRLLLLLFSLIFFWMSSIFTWSHSIIDWLILGI
jgi:hypothetical protein